MHERFELPMLNHDEGSLEQLAQRLAAHAIGYEIQRLEDDERVTGWERLRRDHARTVAGQLRQIAMRLFEAGTRGLEERVKYELARSRGFPCQKCGHRHEGARYSRRCFYCACSERTAST